MATQIKGPLWEENRNNKKADAGAIQIEDRKGRRRATAKRADAEAIQMKGPQRIEKGDNKESGC